MQKLIFVTEVNIEATSGGEMLLYKLFNDNNQFEIEVHYINAENKIVDLSKQSNNCKYYYYKIFKLKGERFKIVRVFNQFLKWLTLKYVLIKKINNRIKSEDDFIFVTIIHGLSWYFTYSLAKKYKKKLINFLHDDYIYTLKEPILINKLKYNFKQSLLYTEKNFFISDEMKKNYKNEIDSSIKGKVVMPLSYSVQRVNKIYKSKNNQIIMGYAGSLWGDYIRNLIAVAHALDKMNGSLICYTNRSLDYLILNGLKTDNVKILPFAPMADVLDFFSLEVNSLYLPMDFDINVIRNIKLAFPSKLADYMLLDYPIFYHAPSYSSIVKWVYSNKLNNCVVVDSTDEKIIFQKLELLKNKLQSNNYSLISSENAKIWETYFNMTTIKLDVTNSILMQ